MECLDRRTFVQGAVVGGVLTAVLSRPPKPQARATTM
jgi:hypothetical protein